MKALHVSAHEARALLTFGHIVAFLSLEAKAQSGLPSGAVFVAVCCHLVALVSLVSGVEMFSNEKSWWHVILQFLGGVMTARMQLLQLPPSYLWYIVCCSCVPSLVWSVHSAISIFVFRREPY